MMNILKISLGLIFLVFSTSALASQNRCFDYVKSITADKRDVIEAVLLSSRVNNISPSVLLAFLITENHKFLNLAQNRSGDVGLFQINIKTWKFKTNILMDMAKNAVIAGAIIRHYFSKDTSFFGLTRYHSGTKKYNVKYRERLKRNFKRVLKKKEKFPECEQDRTNLWSH